MKVYVTHFFSVPGQERENVSYIFYFFCLEEREEEREKREVKRKNKQRNNQENLYLKKYKRKMYR